MTKSPLTFNDVRNFLLDLERSSACLRRDIYVFFSGTKSSDTLSEIDTDNVLEIIDDTSSNLFHLENIIKKRIEQMKKKAVNAKSKESKKEEKKPKGLKKAVKKKGKK